MAHIMSMFDSEWVRALDLGGKDITVTIERVVAGEVKNVSGAKKKPIVYFKGAKKPLAFNVTNARTVMAMYGTDTTAWVGKLVTLYPTTTSFGRDTCECIRIRPTVPKGKGTVLPEAPAPDVVMGDHLDATREPGVD